MRRIWILTAIMAALVLCLAGSPALGAEYQPGPPGQPGGQGKAAAPAHALNPADLPEAPEGVAEAPARSPFRYTPEVLKKKQEMQQQGLTQAPQAPAEGGDLDTSVQGLQSPQNPLGLGPPTFVDSFEGIKYTKYIPPDTIGTVGPSHVLTMVNSSVQAFTKTGQMVFKKTLTSWFKNVTKNYVKKPFIFDPKCTYDPWSQRYIMTALASDFTTYSYYLVSVSMTDSVSGGWLNYIFDARVDGSTPTPYWADYDQVGFDSGDINSGHIYLTSNQFDSAGNFHYSKVRVLNKSELYNGQAATWTDFMPGYFTLQPAQTHTATTFGGSIAEYLVATSDPGGSNTIEMFQITFQPAPQLLHLTRSVEAYSLPPQARQPIWSDVIDTGDCRLLGAVLRNGYLYTTTATNNGGYAALKYYQMDMAGATVILDRTFSATGYDYFYPAITVDVSSNIVMVFNRSSALNGEFASVRYSGRKTTDTSMLNSAELIAGLGPYARYDSNGLNRWGDYSGIATDFYNGNDVWIFGEYAAKRNKWGTRVGLVYFP